MSLVSRHHGVLSGVIIAYCLMASLCYAQETLSWQDCLREAAKNHPELISAAESVRQSQEDKVIAASGLFPQISADAGGSTSRSDTTGTTKSFSYGISGQQLIFDGFKTNRQARAASEDLKASQESFRFTSSEVRWRLRTAFIGLLKAQDLVDLTDEIVRIRTKNLQLISLRYDSGREHRGALLNARANVAQAEFDRKSAQRALDTARQSLIKELGRDDFSSINVQGDFDLKIDLKDDPDFYAIAAKHPSVLKSVAQKNAAGFDVQSSRSEFLPTVSVSGDLGKTGRSWPPDDFSSGAGFTVSLPLFEGGARLARLAKSQSLYRQRQADERSAKEDVVLSLRESWNAFEDAVDNIDVQKKFLAAAEERSKISEAQYAVGLVSFDNWTIIEDAMVRQKRTLLDAQANALLAQADWVLAQGETLEYE